MTNIRRVTVRIEVTPPREVSPNVMVHWATKQRAQQSLKTITGWHVKQALNMRDLPALPWQLDYVVAWEKGRKRMDDDNIKAALKYVQDGIADTVGYNDKHMVIGTVEQIRDPAKSGYIEVTITGGTP